MAKVNSSNAIGVVIPAFKATRSILEVLSRIGPEVSHIVVVDDSCPENTGEFVKSNCRDSRVQVVQNKENMGVGGATILGMSIIADSVDVLVKIDADGQMDPTRLRLLTDPISLGEADYAKATRFTRIEHLKGMPVLRILGNGALTFLSKLSTGYWSLTDPTNGYIALSANLYKAIPLEKLDKRFFFESDLLFRANLARALVLDIPMEAIYGDEISSLSVSRAFFSFAWKHGIRILKRLWYRYFVLEWSPGTIFLLAGLTTFLFGLQGAIRLATLGNGSGSEATAGEVMLYALPLIIGYQSLMTFVTLDVSSSPTASQFSKGTFG